MVSQVRTPSTRVQTVFGPFIFSFNQVEFFIYSFICKPTFVLTTRTGITPVDQIKVGVFFKLGIHAYSTPFFRVSRDQRTTTLSAIVRYFMFPDEGLSLTAEKKLRALCAQIKHNTIAVASQNSLFQDELPPRRLWQSFKILKVYSKSPHQYFRWLQKL